MPRWKRQLAAQRIAKLIAKQHWFRSARSLALYFANDGEIDPVLLIDEACRQGKCLLLPRLRQQQLEFVRYRPGHSMLRRNRFNIDEPVGPAVPLHRVDVVFMPLVGFDCNGGRLGMGGGFYDRTFAQVAKGLKGAPRLIGLAYACQEVTQLPREAWDVPMAGVVTEREWIRMR